MYIYIYIYNISVRCLNSMHTIVKNTLQKNIALILY